MAWTSVITNGGLSLLAGGAPHIESVWGGSGTVKEAALLAQTTLAEPKQQGSIVAYEAENLGGRLKLQFGAAEEEYTLRQIGIFAKGAGEGESILFALLQNSEGIKISAQADWPSFVYTHYCQMNLANAKDFTVNIDSGALVSLSTLQEALADYIQLDESGKIPDEVLPAMNYIPKTDRGKAGGVASLGADGKILLDQLVIDAALSATSGNPVQNKVVQQAIEAINQTLAGKAPANHTHLYAGSSSAGGAANTAVKLQTARSVQVNLGSTAAINFDGSGNISPGVQGILGIGNGGTGANNAAAARNNLGINLANLGGCRIVTGQYTGNGEKRQSPVSDPNNITGGQFINLGATPKIVIVVMLSTQQNYIRFSNETSVIATDITRSYLNNGWRATAGEILNNNNLFPLEIVSNGFYAGDANRMTSCNANSYTYLYIAIF